MPRLIICPDCERQDDFEEDEERDRDSRGQKIAGGCERGLQMRAAPRRILNRASGVA